MAKYRYRAKTPSGDRVEGVYEATTRDEVLSMMNANGYYPLYLEEMKQSRDVDLGFVEKVKLSDLSIFCRQAYTMLDAGVSINTIFHIMANQLPNKRLRQAIKLVEDDLSKGETISKAMGNHMDVFPKLLVSMIEVGEISGNLEGIMQRMSTQYEKENKINQKVKSAMIYPIILSIVAVLVVTFILTFVMPTFMSMFTESGVALPLPTRMLIASSEFLQTYFFVIVIVVMMMVFGIRMYGKTVAGQYLFSSLKLRVPVIKELNKKLIVSRFTRTMSTLIASGIPIMKSIELVTDVIENKIAQDALNHVRDEVAKGKGLSTPISEVEIFPQMLSSMMMIGEETGMLDEILAKTADFYDDELEYQIQTTTSLVEPLMILAMGVVIGFIVISIMVPMLEMYSTI